MADYKWTILRLRSVPGDSSQLRDIFWRLTATEGEHTATMESSFTLAIPVAMAGLTQASLAGIIEREISAVDIERDAKGKSTQPDGFDGNALELYRLRLAQELERMAKPKPMELEVPQ